MFLLPLQVIDRHVCPEPEATVTFSNIDTLIPAGARHLVVIVNAATSAAIPGTPVLMRINGDAFVNYHSQELYGIDATDSAARPPPLTSVTHSLIPGPPYANAFGGGVMVIPHAFNTSGHKIAISPNGAGEYVVHLSLGRWANVAAITSILLFPDAGNFVPGSIITLAVIDEQYLVEEITDPGADFSPTWDNIPQGEGDLVVIGYPRSDLAAVEDEVLHTINDDGVAGNYPGQELTGRAAVTGAASPVNQEIGMVSGDNATPNVFGALVAIYSQFTKSQQPHYLSLSGYHETSGPTSEVRLMSGRRANIEPINKLALTPNGGTDFKAGSLFSLYRVPKRLIDRQELTVDTATITFANIPDYFEALQLHAYARTDRADVSDTVYVALNTDVVDANYDAQHVSGTGAVVTAVRFAAARWLYQIPGNNEGVGEYGGGTCIIPAYARTDGHKHLLVLTGRMENNVVLQSTRWESLNAINRIDLTPGTGPNFLSGSVFELEGVLRKEGLPTDAGMTFGV